MLFVKIQKCKKKMNRLEFISQHNPFWAITISNFMDEYPEFKSYLYVAPLNPIEPIPYKNVRTLFEAIMHYICASGVRYDYAVKQWTIIYPLINQEDWNIILENVSNLLTNNKIQNKKREIYYKLCIFMNENNITHKNLDMTHINLLQKNVSGIGVGCVAWCKKYFTFDDDCIEYTDICFKKGFEKVYNTNSLSVIKQKVKEWQEKGFGRIGNLMILQIYTYA